jgi:hypothetical protein
MTIGGLFRDLGGALVVLSLIAIALIMLAWIVIPVVTVLAAWRRGRRRRPAAAAFEMFAGAYSEADLAEIDEALEVILARERRGALTSGG